MNNTTYLDFDLLIERGQRTGDAVRHVYRVRVLNSPAGQAVGAFELPFSDTELRSFFQSLFRGQVNGRLNPHRFGNQLFAAIFRDAVGNSLVRSLDAAEREGKGLRLRLRLNDVPELATLPWEYLHSPTDERFLVLSDQTPIVRYLELAATEQPLELVRPLRILMVIANPINFPPLNVEYEWKKVQDALFDLQNRGLVEIERLRRATLPQLQKHLRQGEYHILHFIGHGVFDSNSNSGSLVLVNEKGRADFAPASVLGTLLRDHRSLRLAFLNACEGARASDKNPFAGTGQRLVQQGLPSVIAMQFPVSDKAAIMLTHEFYQALADGYPVDAALGEARKAIFTRGNLLEWGTPVLFMRAPDGRLFEIDGGGEEGPAPGVPPFKGLHYFEENDADRFFGREKLTGQLVAKLREHRFLAVIGASGSGKSSLVRAGLIPALKQGDGAKAHGVLPPEGSQLWAVHIITPTAHPLENLAASLTADSDSVSATDALRNELAQNAHSLHLYVRKLLSKQTAPRLLLVIDQFEELFTLCRSAEVRQAFVDNLMHAVMTDGPTVVLITLRADFYAQCAQFEQLRQILAKQQEFIGPMNEEELRRAIEEPARRGKWEFEPGLVDQLLKDVGSEPGALPLLSHALLETWKRRRARTLTFAGYASAGGIKGAIAKTAEQVFNQRFNDEQQYIARQLFLQLTELGEGTQDTRRRVALKELLPTSRSQNTLAVQGVLQTLSNARLVTVSTDNAEVAHEALIREWPTLRAWLDEDREGLRIHRQLSEDAGEWLALNYDQGALYRGARLAKALEWAETHIDQLNTLERRFLGTSKELAEREQLEEQEQQRRELAQARALAKEQARARKRSNQFVMGLMIFLILTVGLAIFGFYNARQARNNAQEAQRNAQEAQENQQKAVKESRISLAKSLVGQVPYILETTNDSGLATLLSLESLYLNQQLEGDAQELLGFSLLDVLSQEYFNMILGNHKASIRSVAFSPDGNMLVSATEEGNLHFWDLSQAGLDEKRVKGHLKGITIAAFAPDGTLASGGSDGIIRLWDLTGSEPTSKVLARDLDKIKSLAFSPLSTSSLLAAAGEASTISIWDLSHPDRAPVLLQSHQVTVNSVAFSSDGKFLASGDVNGKIYWWDLASPPALSLPPQSDQSETNGIPDSALQPASQVITPIAALPKQASEVHALAFSPDGRWFATASAGSIILIYDLRDLNADPIKLNGHTNAIVSLDFNSDGTKLASASFDLTVRLWDLSKGPAQATSTKLSGHADYVYTVAFSPNGEHLASGSLDWVVRLWNLPKSDQARSSKMISAAPIILNHHQQKVWSVAFSADGKHMATGSDDGQIRLWPTEVISNPSLQPTLLTGHEKKVESLAFHPDGQMLASASEDKTIRLWDINHPTTPIALLTGHEKGIRSVAFSPDGKTLASGSDDNSIRLWDTTNITNLQAESTVLARQEASVLSVAFSPDGKTLASASNDGTISLWDLTNPDFDPKVLRGHTKLAQSVTFSPDGKWLASGGGDHNVRLWDLTYPDPNKKPMVFEGHRNRVNFVAFTPDGKSLISAAGDRTIRLWDPTKPEAKAFVFIGHTDWVRSLAFTPDGETLASSSDDGTVRLWIAGIDKLTDLGCKLARRNLSWTEWQPYLANEPYRRTCPDFPAHPTAIEHLIKEAKKLARKGDVAQASLEFQNILQLQPDRELLLRLDSNFEYNPRVDAERYAKAYQFVTEGQHLLKEEHIEGANTKFYQAIDLDPTLNAELQREVKALAPTFVKDGQELAQIGRIDQALDKFNKAQQLDPEVSIPADAWHQLCQFGTEREYAQKVLRACDEAIKLDPTNRDYYQTRSLVRQFTGDQEGAFEDLQFYLQSQQSNGAQELIQP